MLLTFFLSSILNIRRITVNLEYRLVHSDKLAVGKSSPHAGHRRQVLTAVIVDVAKPPSGKLDLFNLYVVLSRSSGRCTIRLLRDFEDAVFMMRHDPELQQQDDRLEKLDQNTKLWWTQMKNGLDSPLLIMASSNLCIFGV